MDPGSHAGLHLYTIGHGRLCHRHVLISFLDMLPSSSVHQKLEKWHSGGRSVLDSVPGVCLLLCGVYTSINAPYVLSRTGSVSLVSTGMARRRSVQHDRHHFDASSAHTGKEETVVIVGLEHGV